MTRHVAHYDFLNDPFTATEDVNSYPAPRNKSTTSNGTLTLVLMTHAHKSLSKYFTAGKGILGKIRLHGSTSGKFYNFTRKHING